jgi:hypothetical protein
MPDIFLSYAREDQTRVGPLVGALEGQGWSVFWDRRIPAGQTWRSHIRKALDEARCVIVAWTRDSIASDWVIEEADVAKRRGVLVPILLDPVEPPMGLRAIQAADLTDWDADPAAPRFRQLFEDIQAVLSAAPPAPPPPLSMGQDTLPGTAQAAGERPASEERREPFAPTRTSALHREPEGRRAKSTPSQENARTKAIAAVLGSLGGLAALVTLLLVIWMGKPHQDAIESVYYDLYRAASQDIERMKARQDMLEDQLRRIGATPQELRQINAVRTSLERSFTAGRLENANDQAMQLATIYEQKLRERLDDTLRAEIDKEEARRALERELNELRALSATIGEMDPIRNTR